MTVKTQLEAYVEARGAAIVLPKKTLTVDGVSSDGDIAVATFRVTKWEYTGVMCPKAKVFGRPGAEVWSVMGPRGRKIAEFAVHRGEIVPIS